MLYEVITSRRIEEPYRNARKIGGALKPVTGGAGHVRYDGAVFLE